MRIFIGMPAATLTTPVADPHFAGSFAFFGADHGAAHHAGGGLNYAVDISRVLQRLAQAGALTDRPAQIRFVLVPMATPARQRNVSVTIGSVAVELIELE